MFASFYHVPSSWSLLYLAYAWCWRIKRDHSASRSRILFQLWYWMSWSDWCDVLCLLEQTVTFQLISGPAYDIIHNFPGGCIVGARLQTIPTCHMLKARLEGWFSQWRIRGLSEPSLPSNKRVSLPTSSASHPDLPSLGPFYFPDDDKKTWEYFLGCLGIRDILILISLSH